MNLVKKGFGITHMIFIPKSKFKIKCTSSKEASRENSKMILLALALVKVNAVDSEISISPLLSGCFFEFKIVKCQKGFVNP